MSESTSAPWTEKDIETTTEVSSNRHIDLVQVGITISPMKSPDIFPGMP
jgi:hypothetical protein